MTANGRVTIGLPAFNEEIALPRLLRRIDDMAAKQPVSVVVYNDGSTDTTPQIARDWQGRVSVHLLDSAQNKGLGAGLRALIEYAVASGRDEDVLVIMDCDDTHDPLQARDMLAVLTHGADVVIASRYRKGSTVQGVPLVRRITALGALVLFKLIHPVRGVWDYTCGYRAYRVGVLKQASDHYRGRLVTESGFACMVEVLLKLNALGVRFAEIPLQLRYDLKPTMSKMGVGGNIGRQLRLLLRWRWRGFGA